MKIHNKDNTYYITWYTIALLLYESQSYIYTIIIHLVHQIVSPHYQTFQKNKISTCSENRNTIVESDLW